MKAVRFHAYGDSDVLVHEDTDRPVPGAGQVVLRVAGTSFNPVDVVIRAGTMKDVFPVEFPHTPGVDVAGVVTATGEGAGSLRSGDAVIGFLPMNVPGSAAEYVAAPAEILAAAPEHGELADAAALPAVGLTAWQALFEHADLKAGQSILINGAGGAVGGYAVQLAARAKAEVTATAGARSAERVRSFGASRVVDYAATPVVEAVAGRRFDVVLNLVRTGDEETQALVDLVADGGIYVSTTTPGTADAARGVRTASVYVRSDASQLAELVGLVDAGELRIDVARRRPLTELAAVHDEAVSGRLAGKTVLTP
ncbi:MAG TPA: NADP-dependent oxidoreductase [Stackebrandtia sp.]|uniref:NADP-dependent oxidoreductase n=1 Tax=Stackebrandtia sp. TaxID=2023065 RepID=UPI002D3A9BCE|nr:NADP-dependent oxidoreductase [Stackebrandtia sp.]HZE42028.1 NADP-dependent oxidoreductase [Stackebrandtia sp.]